MLSGTGVWFSDSRSSKSASPVAGFLAHSISIWLETAAFPFQ